MDNMDSTQFGGANTSAVQIFKSPNCVCSCGSRVFQQAVILKNVSSFVSPTGKNEIYPIPTYICAKCGKICKEFLEKPAAPTILGLSAEEIGDMLSDNKSEE